MLERDNSIPMRLISWMRKSVVVKRFLYPILSTFLRENYLEIIIKIYIYQFILNIDDKYIYIFEIAFCEPNYINYFKYI